MKEYREEIKRVREFLRQRPSGVEDRILIGYHSSSAKNGYVGEVIKELEETFPTRSFRAVDVAWYCLNPAHKMSDLSDVCVINEPM